MSVPLPVNSVPLLVQFIPVVVDNECNNPEGRPTMTQKCSIASQTDGIRKPTVVHHTLNQISSHIFKHYPWLQCRLLTWGQHKENSAIEVTRVKVDILPDRGGPTTVAKVVLFNTGSAEFCVAGDIIETVTIFSPNQQSNALDFSQLEYVLSNLGDTFVFCAGILKSEFNSVCSAVRYQSKSFEEKTFPFPRLISKKCLKWYRLRYNANKAETEAVLKGDNRCTECNTAYRDARKCHRSNVKNFSETRKRRIEPTSHYPIGLLSPCSKKKRLDKLKLEKKKATSQLNRFTQKLEHLEVELSEEHSLELADFINNVQDTDLDGVLDDVDENADADAAHALREAFHADQKRNGM